MKHAYFDKVFTPSVRAAQTRMGTREQFASLDVGEPLPVQLGPREVEFVSARESFYQATVSETLWPYLQHRGGPKGFLKVLDARTIAYADFSGNEQYISVGNLTANPRIALFLMDYPHQRRLKIMGEARLVEAAENPELMQQLARADYPANVERALVITVAGFSWNCSQHIPQRFTVAEFEAIFG
jgi:predicted pyridoxine 5'-phosphate oxidase superfamily flavin-nucleotide-binding protein